MNKILKNIFIGDTQGTYISEVYRKTVVINLFGAVGAMLALLFGIDAYLREESEFAIFLFIMLGVVIATMLYLRKSKKYIIAGYVLVIAMFIANLYLLLIVGQKDNTAPMWHYVFPATALFASNRKFATILISALILISILGLELIPDLKEMYSTFYKVRFYGTFATVVAISYIFEYVREKTYEALEHSNVEKSRLIDKVTLQNEEISSQKDLLSDTNDQISKTNMMMTNSIIYAQNIQESILPDLKLIQKHFSDAFVLFLPRDIVSGDFYWFSIQGNKKYVAVVDCTGHGVPGALMSMIGNTLLNEIVNNKKIYEPIEILHELHKGVQFSLTQKGGDGIQDDGMEVSITCFDKSENKITIACAGQYAAFTSSGNDRNQKELEIVEGGYSSIGYVSRVRNEIDFQTKSFNYDEIANVYMFSDGYQDQFGGVKNRKFMSTQFKKLLLENQYLSMEEQKNVLISTFENWKSENDQVDDVLVLGLHV